MSQLYDGNQPTLGNGGYVWESYKSAGAKVTNKPIVGYAFSALDGWLWAVGSAGHTGVVIAVFDDGWIILCANFNEINQLWEMAVTFGKATNRQEQR